ncbi:unnamed protein product [Boreogadus saida]
MERERAHGPTRSGPQGRRGQLDRGSSAPGEAQLRRTVLFLCALSVQPQHHGARPPVARLPGCCRLELRGRIP